MSDPASCGSIASKNRQSEGESNRSPRHQDWTGRTQGPAVRGLVEADTRHFLHQSVSTPCLSAIAKAEGIWIEDMDGRRFMDFHGNSAHHIGYGHPRLKAAIKAQLDELPFAPRRYTCEPAVALAAKLAEISPPGLEKMLFTTGGSDAIEVAIKIARTATGRFKTISFWDAFHGAGFGAASVGGDILAMNVVRDINEKMPELHLVMHGSSSVPQALQDIFNEFGGEMPQTYGVPVDEIVRGIQHGVRKVNIDTDCRLAMTGIFRRIAEQDRSQFDPRKFLAPALEAMQELCRDRFEQFGTAGKASSIKPISVADMAAAYASGALDPKLTRSKTAA